MTQEQQTIESFWKDKRVLITGGTKGLGNALTKRLEDLGAIVTIVARTSNDLNAMRRENIYTITANIGEKESIHRISGQTVGMMEGIDVIFNNASTLGVTPLQNLMDTECETFEEVLQTNLLGPFRLIKTLVPYMKFNGWGLIVNISSDAAVNPYPNWGAYSISKAALDHLTAIWKEELVADSINFVSIDPGDMYTQMHLDAIPDSIIEELYDPQEVANQLLQFLIKDSFEKSRYTASEWREEIN